MSPLRVLVSKQASYIVTSAKGHCTVVCLVLWALNRSEAVMLKKPSSFLCTNCVYSYVSKLNM